ncbi:MAG: hypothetical protein D6689_10910 [Deltaproteobacteria bacterium]|nr:MAG: hypothetical protein D6689_10910 [Deltaproteobacteria bacterium]
MRTDIPTEALDAIAAALEYPHAGSERAARAAADALRGVDDEVAAAFAALADWLRDTPRAEQEELYTRLFDLRPACTLHVGYHVWGDAYQRGELLAGLVGELRRANIDPGRELPDFLPNVLRLWGRIDVDDDARLFHDRVLAVGVGRMAAELRRVTTPWAVAVASLSRLFPQSGASRGQTEAERNWEALHV